MTHYKTILVTGGAGFIGSNFVHHLYHNYPDYRILVLDALTYAGTTDNLPGHAEDERLAFWYGNVRNGELVDTLVAQSNIIFHFAADSHVTRSIYDNFQFFETDVIGTQVVANAVFKYRKNIERFIHISSSEVYGTALTEKMAENHPLEPASPYAAAKAGADRLVYSYWKTYDIPATIVRAFNNYGPYQHLEKAIPRFITSCLLKEPVTVHGQGEAMRDWLYVKDHCRALDMLMHCEQHKIHGEVFNIGTEISYDIKTIAQIIVKIMGIDESCITYIDDRPGQVDRHTADTKKIQQVLGWKPQVNFEEGLTHTIQWYQENTKWWERQKWLRHVPLMTVVSTGGRKYH